MALSISSVHARNSCNEPENTVGIVPGLPVVSVTANELPLTVGTPNDAESAALILPERPVPDPDDPPSTTK